jgi:hypothetical protein
MAFRDCQAVGAMFGFGTVFCSTGCLELRSDLISAPQHAQPWVMRSALHAVIDEVQEVQAKVAEGKAQSAVHCDRVYKALDQLLTTKEGRDIVLPILNNYSDKNIKDIANALELEGIRWAYGYTNGWKLGYFGTTTTAESLVVCHMIRCRLRCGQLHAISTGRGRQGLSPC